MGAEYISGGLTVDATRTIENVQSVVKTFHDQIIAKADDIDPAGFFEVEDLADLVDSIASGVQYIRDQADGGRYVAAWDVPGRADLRFLTFGGLSWGDSPFEEYDSVCFAGEAAAHIPDFGRAVGILGGGIRLDYSE